MNTATLTAARTGDKQAHVGAARVFAVHPYLLALFPVITIWAGNIREVTLGEGLGVALMAGGLAALAMAAARRVYATREQAALAVTACTILFLSYGVVENANTWLSRWNRSLELTPAVAITAWVAAISAMLWSIGRRADTARQLTRLANMFAGSLTIMSLYLMASAVWISPWIWERPLPGELEPASLFPIQPPATAAPDIYLLMFDRYASESVLADHFDYDNRSFYRQLEDRGFEVLQNSFANYPKTELEMSAMLNMRYHHERVWPKCHYRAMLKNHLVGRLLTEHGYRYYHLGNLHNGIRTNPHADANYRFSRMPTELLENLFRMTPLAAFWPSANDATQTLDKFERIVEYASEPHPKFIYAHFLVPHPPWKFD